MPPQIKPRTPPSPLDRIVDTRFWKYYLAPTSLRAVNIFDETFYLAGNITKKVYSSYTSELNKIYLFSGISKQKIFSSISVWKVAILVMLSSVINSFWLVSDVRVMWCKTYPNLRGNLKSRFIPSENERKSEKYQRIDDKQNIKENFRFRFRFCSVWMGITADVLVENALLPIGT